MRQVVLDTETTGLEPELGHRIIEIGCVELVNRRRTGRNFHCYLQPEREIDDAAISVHGLTSEFLAGQPRFADVAEQLLAYLEGAELVIHNAEFDLQFLSYELDKLPGEWPQIEQQCRVLDTLMLARRLHPGQRNSLDALCKRYEVDNSRREFHGALLDAEILADVYLIMTGGQTALVLGESAPAHGMTAPPPRRIDRKGIQLVVIMATDAEEAAHAERLAAIDRKSPTGCLWLRDPDAAPAQAAGQSS